MPGKPRGKGKASLSEMREKMAAERGTKSEGEQQRPPTSEEFMKQQQQKASSSSSQQQEQQSKQQQQQQKRGLQFTNNSKGELAAKHGGGAGKNNVSKSAFIPPGADINSKGAHNSFMYQFEEHFLLPRRLRNVPSPLVEAVNDFHYAMMNDLPRNEFYYQMLKEAIVPGETTVLEIGAGSGLLSMMAASLGAKWVVAVEGSNEMARLAQRNVDANKFTGRVKVLNKMSYDLNLQKDLNGEKPDVLVSEIFGTLLLGESALDYLEDIRKRNILKPSSKILPRFGRQYCCLVECPILEEICAVKTWRDLDLTLMNSLRDTASVVFTKKYGFRMSSVPFKRLTEPLELIDIDFQKTCVRDIPMEFDLQTQVRETGTGHAWLYWWQAWNSPDDIKDLKVDPKTGTFDLESFDQVKVMSTDPEATREKNFARDMQWGQALQLVDAAATPLPKHLNVVAASSSATSSASSSSSSSASNENDNENSAPPPPTPVASGPSSLVLTARTSEDRVVLQIEVGGDGIGDEDWSGNDEEDFDFEEGEEGEEEEEEKKEKKKK